MKLRWMPFCALLALSLPAAQGQNTDSQLPSAPSAVKQEQQAPPKTAAPPTSVPAQAPADPAQPAAAQSPTGASVEPKSTTTPSPVPAPEAKDETSAQPESHPKAPSPPPPKGDEDASVATIRKTVNEVNVVFTVTDKHGRYVKDLKQNDFRVLDDSRPAKEIRTFRSETDLPLQVGLLIDASNSVRDRFRFEQEAAIEFLNQIIRTNYDKAFVVGFDTTPEVTQDFTDNSELLSRGVHMLRAGGGTAMYDALYFACRDKLLKSPRTGPVRRAVILLSDGQDNQSRVTREEAIEMAQRADVIVYAISTNISGVKQNGDKILERIADATGGRAFFPFQMTDVSNAFAEIQDELRSQYLLAYIPENFQADGRFRTIQILSDQKHLHVRARRGYFAPSK